MNFKQKLRDLDVKGYLSLSLITIGMILIVVYFEGLLNIIKTLLDTFLPVFIGIGLAFIFNMPMNYYERKLPIKKDKTRKLVSAILAIATVLAFVVILLVAVIPQIADNISSFINNSSSLLDSLWQSIEDILVRFNVSSDVIETIGSYETSIDDTVFNLLENSLPDIVSIVSNVSSKIVDFFIGFIMSIYILLSKDMLFRLIDKMECAIFNEKHYMWIKDFENLVSKSFGDFIFGQIKEAIIIGVLCYIGCLILDIPYGLICSLVIGITNVVPYFGPVVGAVIDFVILFLVDPFQAVVFIIFSTCLQQIESHFIYPQVVGRSVGLSPIWVLFSVSIGGSLFGIVGMLIGIPTFSVIYELVRRWANARIAKKKLKKQSNQIICDNTNQ